MKTHSGGGRQADADRNITLAKDKIKNGDIVEAMIYLNRAENIKPTSEAKKILKYIQANTEKLNAVNKVIKCDNYYDVLFVKPTASSAEIQDAYKKIAFLVHPDKIKAPAAKRAFQMVRDARYVLTNPSKRKEYDISRKKQELSLQLGKVFAWAMMGKVNVVLHTPDMPGPVILNQTRRERRRRR